MRKPKSFLRVFTDTGPLVALAVAIALLIGIVGPASAQFFNFGGFGGAGATRSVAAAGSAAISFSHSSSRLRRRRARISPVRRARQARPVPERNVLVLGDAMADWLAYGLEDAYSEQPDMGVIRKHKTVSGLIKYQPKGEPSERHRAAAAKSILASEKPDAIVVMLGLNDRTAIRETAVPDKGAKKRKRARRTRAPNRAMQSPSLKARLMLPRPRPARLMEPRRTRPKTRYRQG